ncbi:hypothetical protein GALMADRAFT_141585 [Galerina marginata CBS 339.88]|uniref:Uncharacterized protein n=1 Tax=Galerina marginata (strain CBS 339.88) TaxID=685588 RepID=A0A067SUG2_GALM3|nr:hypothetical protein GALMADRAFT_141585 [Galerina marginata CBS 339.88]
MQGHYVSGRISIVFVRNHFCLLCRPENKFFYYVRTCNSWSEALRRVRKEWQLVWDHDDLLLVRGYLVLDPFVFANEKLWEERMKVFLIGWLAIRAVWIYRTTSRLSKRDQIPEPQQWKNYLMYCVGPRLGFPAEQKNPTKRIKTPAELLDLFRLDLSNISGPVRLVWKRGVIATLQDVQNGNARISLQMTKEIIWDLYDLNFRLEMLALDRCVVPHEGLSEYAALERDLMVAACFYGMSFVRVDIPSTDEGLGAPAWEDRMEYVEAFRLLLCTWPGSPSGRLRSMSAITRTSSSSFSSTSHQVSAVKGIAYPFYCQTFFEYFGRAPSVPHQLPL